MRAEDLVSTPIAKIYGPTTTQGGRYVGYSVAVSIWGVEAVITAPTKAGLVDIWGRLGISYNINMKLVLKTCTFESAKVTPQ